MTALTPYDTGARLEPQLWPAGSPEDFGLVDFDNEEGHTVFSAHAERTGTGYTLYLTGIASSLTVTIHADHPREV
jgi:hypothetical protein